MSDIMSYLFKTNAIRFCEENKPFWYTSGKIGPYFINTHFVFGNEGDAVSFLSFIDECLSDKITLPKKVFERALEQYNNNEIYKNVIDTMKKYIEDNINVSEIDYVSGGERRDWFFSYIIANILNKPHITVFKDLDTVVSDSNFENTAFATPITGKKVLHITDLITIASSYIRAWIPAIQNLGGELVWSLSVVDRKQGGADRLRDLGITSYSLIEVDDSLFKTAFDNGLINKMQLDMVCNFIKDPDGSMREFLVNNPDFLENALHADEKTAGRARLCIDGNLYNL